MCARECLRQETGSASPCFVRLTQARPSNCVGCCCSQDYEAALNDFAACLLLSPDNVSALYGRGLAQQKLGRMNQAIEDYTKVMELDPGHVNAAYARAACYNSKGLFAKAIDDYNLALTKDQDKLSSSNAKRKEERRRRTSSLADSPYLLLRQVVTCCFIDDPWSRRLIGVGTFQYRAGPRVSTCLRSPTKLGGVHSPLPTMQKLLRRKVRAQTT